MIDFDIRSVAIQDSLSGVLSTEGSLAGKDFDVLCACFARPDGSSYFEEIAQKLGVRADTLTKESAQAVLVSMAANCKAQDLSAFNTFNQFISPTRVVRIDALEKQAGALSKEYMTLSSEVRSLRAQKKKLEKSKKRKDKETVAKIEKEMAQLVSQKKEIDQNISALEQESAFWSKDLLAEVGHQDLILRSEIPFISAISMMQWKDNLNNDLLTGALEANKRAEFSKDYRGLEKRSWGILNYLSQVQKGTWVSVPGFAEPELINHQVYKQALAQDFTIYNLADPTIPEGTVVQTMDAAGNIHAYETHQLMDIKGLRCIAYTSMNPTAAPEVKVVFCGTTDAASGLLDGQKHSPGYRSMLKREAHLIDQLNQLVGALYQQTGQPVKVDIQGHSLGGALAQHFHAAVTICCAQQHATDQEILQTCSPGSDVFENAAQKQKAATQLNHDLPRYTHMTTDHFHRINQVALTTKFGAKGSNRDDYLARAAVHVLKDKLGNGFQASNLVLRHEGDWVHRSGETQSMVKSQDVNTQLVKIRSSEEKWGDLHNCSFADEGNSAKRPLAIVLNLDTLTDRNAVIMETEKSKRMLRVGTGIGGLERTISGLRGITKKGAYQQTALPRSSPVLFRFGGESSSGGSVSSPAASSSNSSEIEASSSSENVMGEKDQLLTEPFDSDFSVHSSFDDDVFMPMDNDQDLTKEKQKEKASRKKSSTDSDSSASVEQSTASSSSITIEEKSKSKSHKKRT